jgi:electron transport complex protein RnfG
MNIIIKHALMTAGILTVFTVIGTAMLAGTFETTKAPIAQSEREAKLNLLAQVMPAQLHDNDLLRDTLQLPPAELLGQRTPSVVYRARQNGEPAGAILEAIAPDGYSGDIKLLIGIASDGTLTGVRVLAHKETPGLGDYIELAHSDWIKNFDGKSLAKLPDEAWQVKKDGGQFDYMTGATITPRAVVKAVHKALQYFATQRDFIFSAPDNQGAGDTA